MEQQKRNVKKQNKFQKHIYEAKKLKQREEINKNNKNKIKRLEKETKKIIEFQNE